jgi:hypothetical protein
MKRRALLKRTAALAAAGSIAGCLAGGSGSQAEETTTSTRTTTDSTTTDPPDDAFDAMQVGSRDGVLDPDNNRPHSVTVTNDADESRTIEVQVRSTGENPLVESDTWELPARARVHVELLAPGEYTVAVSIDGEEAGQVPVDRSWFDCNSSTTNVTVTADDDLESETISTAVACGPSVRDGSVRVTNSQCASESDADEATPTFEASSVGISGSIRVPSPGCGLEIAGVEWSHDDGTAALTVTVAATEPEDGADMQCVGMLDYEATLTLDNGVPDRLTVEHRSMGETKAVATAGHGSSSAPDDE